MRRRRALPVLILALSVLLAVACGSSDDDAAESATSAPGGDFPVTFEHAFGSTTVDEAPQRVVTWGWGSADAAIALGVVPVAIPFQEYGGDAKGVLPWIREALEAEDQEVPTVLPNTEEAPVEAIAAAKPDLILAPYSGITDQEYELRAAVAPTVAYPGEAWATPWRDVIETVGTALGRSDAADALLADIDEEVAAQAEAHPEFAGKSVAMVWDTADTFYVYKAADARVAFTLDLGFESAESVETLDNGDETFFYTLSKERLDELESDVLVSYADDAKASKTFLGSPSAQLMEQVRDGRVAEVVGTEFIASVSPPTALSLTWGLDEYVAALAKAAKV